MFSTYLYDFTLIVEIELFETLLWSKTIRPLTLMGRVYKRGFYKRLRSVLNKC